MWFLSCASFETKYFETSLFITDRLRFNLSEITSNSYFFHNEFCWHIFVRTALLLCDPEMFVPLPFKYYFTISCWRGKIRQLYHRKTVKFKLLRISKLLYCMYGCWWMVESNSMFPSEEFEISYAYSDLDGARENSETSIARRCVNTCASFHSR